MTERQDVWTDGSAYEPYVGRWSRLVAPEFIAWLAPDPARDWIDVGCGTGELTRAILAAAAPRSVLGVDPSEAFIAYARQHTADARATFAIGDAQDLPADDASADFVVSALVLNFVPDPAAGIAEACRVARPGGTVAAYVWDYAGEMQLMRYFWDAAAELDAAARDFDEGNRFSICHPDALRSLFTSAGLAQVATRAIDVTTRFVDFDDYWSPFLAGRAPAPQYAMSLSQGRREELRELLRSRLPVGHDGSISMVARAWAVSGTR